MAPNIECSQILPIHLTLQGCQSVAYQGSHCHFQDGDVPGEGAGEPEAGPVRRAAGRVAGQPHGGGLQAAPQRGEWTLVEVIPQKVGFVNSISSLCELILHGFGQVW